MGFVTARTNVAAAILSLAVLAGACTGKGDPNPTGSADASQLAALMASTDLFAGAPQRVLVGVLQQDQNGSHPVTGGSVGFAFSYLGPAGTDPAVPGPSVSANYVSAPGLAGSPAGTPTPTDPSVSRGVYEAEGVTFDQAGLWEVAVSADITGFGSRTLTTQFPVTDGPQLLAPGDKAFATKNLTVHSKGADPASIDSRAVDGAPIPDRELHEWTVAEALREHRPVLLLVATPAYCTSQLCGPDTEAEAQLAKTYGDRAVFIHIEVYKDHQAKNPDDQFNEAALQWLEPVGAEPWMWLIGGDGRIIDRWSPVWDPNEVGQELGKLPVMK
jgi:hypothetical protein